jgi:hypothetical protein
MSKPDSASHLVSTDLPVQTRSQISARADLGGSKFDEMARKLAYYEKFMAAKEAEDASKRSKKRSERTADSENDSEEHGSDDPYPDPYLEKAKAKRIKLTVDQADGPGTAAVARTALVKDGFIVLNDGREFDFDFEKGSTLAQVFGTKARLVAASGKLVSGDVGVPKSLMPGRFLNLPIESGLCSSDATPLWAII